MTVKCKICGFDNHIEDADFCQNCGVSLSNFCTNNSCDMNNGDAVPVPYDANYCPYCGSPTTLGDCDEEE